MENNIVKWSYFEKIETLKSQISKAHTSVKQQMDDTELGSILKTAVHDVKDRIVPPNPNW